MGKMDILLGLVKLVGMTGLILVVLLVCQWMFELHRQLLSSTQEGMRGQPPESGGNGDGDGDGESEAASHQQRHLNPDDESTWQGRVPGEGAVVPWPDDLKRRFRLYQTTMNANTYQYNMKVLQTQARPWEAEMLLQTGKWPWQASVRERYVDKMNRHPILNYEPRAAAEQAQRIYNQGAVLLLFKYSTLFAGDNTATN